ncbi:MAG: single-stranded DNA-binding protein [Bacteroidota bacterium]
MATWEKIPMYNSLEGNIAVAKFPLATTETFKDRSGKLVSQTEWHTVVLWRGLAELAQKYLHKSSLVYIEGRLRTRSWDDKDGNRKFATEVVGDNLIMLDKRMDSHASASPGDSGMEGPGSSDTTIGDPSEISSVLVLLVKTITLLRNNGIDFIFQPVIKTSLHWLVIRSFTCYTPNSLLLSWSSIHRVLLFLSLYCCCYYCLPSLFPVRR